ncbi:hypothetical protein [Nitrosopumilus sp. S4]
MKKRQIAIISIASIVVLVASSTIIATPELLNAYAGVTLSNDNVAKTIQIRVNPAGTNIEHTFDSFSRVGFVDGDQNFLLESVPSKDKKPFYVLVQKSLNDKNPLITNTRMNVAIDIFSGDGEIIHTLLYKECDVTEYFVHGVDSKGKIFFLEEDGTVEIREVTKFSCTSFSLEIDVSDIPVSEITTPVKVFDRNKFEIENDIYFSTPSKSEEGELFYNSITNKLQKYVNGTWVDISGVGGPPSPRR